MREKWKYDKQWRMVKGKWLLATGQWRFCYLVIFYCLLILSCKNTEEHKHFSTTKTDDLNGLEHPANETVFSEVKSILPFQKSIVPVFKATGVIAYDPRLLNNITAKFGGRIEKLYVRYNFETVLKGQRIMDIYSPEIVTEQQNLIYLLNNSLNETILINSSKQKLKLLGVTDEQLRQIEKDRKPINPIPVYSLYSGHIHDIGLSNGITNSPTGMGNGMNSGNQNSSNSSSQVQIENLPSSATSVLSVKEGMYVERGQQLFAVYNTNKVWAVLNIFPRDAKFIKIGNQVSITSETNPTHIINAIIDYIEPVAGQNASAIKARVYLMNEKDYQLKIGTLLISEITAEEIKGLWLPRNSIVNLGQNQIVFLKTNHNFTAKKINTGYISDSMVQIVNGLNASNEVAINAQYLVDSESFIISPENE